MSRSPHWMPSLRRQMQVFLKQIQRRIKTTFVFVTHDQDEAITMSDRIVVMSQGRIEQVGTPKDLYYRPRTRFVAGFFGDNNLIEGVVGRIRRSCRDQARNSAACREACQRRPQSACGESGPRPCAWAKARFPSRPMSRR